MNPFELTKRIGIKQPLGDEVIARAVAGDVRPTIEGAGPSAGVFMGPGQPLQPAAQEGAWGRQFDYSWGTNLAFTPRAQEPISFTQLRQLADGYDLIRLLIETRKDQMVKFQWSIMPRDDTKKPDDRCVQFTNFLQFPDKRHNWQTWLRGLLEEMLVVDAACVQPVLTKGGDLLALDWFDGSTLHLLIDDTGRTPIAPDVAYQQVIKGIPAVDYSTDDLIYAPRNLRVNRLFGYSPVEQIIMTVNIALRRQLSQLQYFCYSDDTEVLTKRGWHRFADCVAGDEFATRQIGTGKFEWQKAYRTFRKHYTGEMVRFKGRSLDMLVTPNHRMLVNSLPLSVESEMSVNGEHVISAEQMAEFGTTNTGIPQTSVWVGEEVPEQLFEHSDPRSKSVLMSGDDYCAFMGMYLAEGNCSPSKPGRIAIAQPPDERGAHLLYKALLEKLFGAVCFYGHQFEVCARAVASHLKQFGKAHDKFIPDVIREATPRQLNIFWRYYYLGDGRAKGDDGISTQQAITASRRLADHLTEIGQKMGYSPSVWVNPTRVGRFVHHMQGGFVLSRPINASASYLVSFARRDATRGWHAEWVDYDAPVACVCVPNKFLYVRRNGKACWSGNTEGNIPEALMTVPKEWSPEAIKKYQEMWDIMYSGNTAERKHLKFVPFGTKYYPTKEEVLKDAFDEWLARVCCYAFSLPPAPFVRDQNRATAESAKEAALQEGLHPLMTWVKDLLNLVLWKYMGWYDLQFNWQDEEPTSPMELMTMNTGYVKVGIISIDEARQDLGKEGIGMPNAIFTAAGATLITDILNPPEPEVTIGPDGMPIQSGPPGAPGAGPPPPGGGKAPPFGAKGKAAGGKPPPPDGEKTKPGDMPASKLFDLHVHLPKAGDVLVDNPVTINNPPQRDLSEEVAKLITLAKRNEPEAKKGWPVNRTITATRNEEGNLVATVLEEAVLPKETKHVIMKDGVVTEDAS